MMTSPEILAPSAKMIGLRALVVSDNPICGAVVAEQLGGWGMAVVEAEGSAEALVQLEQLACEDRTPGLIVLNAPTSHEDGLGLATAISTDARYAGTPLMMLAPRAEVTSLDMESAGIGGWLPDEFTEAQLREVVLRIVGPPPSRTGPRERSARPLQYDPEALDHTVIAQLRGLESPSRPNFLRSLVDRYIHSTDGHMSEMRDAVTMGDAERLRLSAHSFKGSSLNLGAHRLAAVCAELEERGRERKLNISTEGLLAKAAYELEHAKIALRVAQDGD